MCFKSLFAGCHLLDNLKCIIKRYRYYKSYVHRKIIARTIIKRLLYSVIQEETVCIIIEGKRYDNCEKVVFKWKILEWFSNTDSKGRITNGGIDKGGDYIRLNTFTFRVTGKHKL